MSSLRCMQMDLGKERLNDERFPTGTSDEQKKVESSVAAFYNWVKTTNTAAKGSLLQRERHVAYLKTGLTELPEGFTVLDASRPWLVYWALHALELLDVRLTEEEGSEVIDFLRHCQDPSGGFGGGPGQYPHLAPTYAAVNALVIIGTKEAYSAINRETLLNYLWRMRTSEGAYRMHEGGEVDIRGVYCAVSVARLTNICSEKLFENTPHWIMRCQTYEGGFSGTPGMEAHGGYTFCGLAALTLLHAHHLCHTPALLKWATNRQMAFEGGFQGRTNKLVDGCYSFWQGGLFPIIHSLLTQEDAASLSNERWMFQQEALQEYLLLCCQHPKGGLLDKPGKGPDFYHTCYTLSGMSVAQHFSNSSIHRKYVVGKPANELALVHPLYNVGVEAAVSAIQHFSNLPVPEVISSNLGKTNEKHEGDDGQS